MNCRTMNFLVRLIVLASCCLVLTASAQAQASTTTINISGPITQLVFNPCANEDVELTGEVRFVMHITVDDTGGRHVKTHTNFEGVSGTGLVTGNEYRLVGSFNEEFNDNGETPQLEMTSNQILNVISREAFDNSLIHSMSHFTINSNGELTALTIRFEFKCAG